MDEEKGFERFHHIGRTFDKTVPTLVPQYDFLQWEAIRLFQHEEDDPFFLIDLGGGSGLFAEKVLTKFPRAEVALVDFSMDFLDTARERLSGFGDRVELIHTDIREDWDVQVGRMAEVITSMSAIHHFMPQEKKLVYQKAFQQLGEGGWFFNIDEMKTFDHQAYRASLAFWRNHVERFYDTLSSQHQDYSYFERWRPFYEEWKGRTFTDNPPPMESSVDKHESFSDQVAWLAEIGFSQVDLFVKYHLWCIIGGRKA